MAGLVREPKADRILAATVDLVASEGAEGVRLQDVARVAGISVGTIQYYFKSRDALIDQALYRYAMDSITTIRNARTSTDPWQDICNMMRAYSQRDNLETRCRVWVALTASALSNIRHLRLLQTLTEEWGRPFREVIVAGVAKGIFHPAVDTEEIVEVIVRVMDGFAVRNATTAVEYDEHSVRRMNQTLERLAALYLGVPMDTGQAAG